ncbi:MAG: dockerin type I domain-containing protein, partial [Phycisphaerae bacterium]
MYVNNAGNATLTNSLFSGNSSDHGGGMLALGFAALANCTFSLNHGTLDSGGYGTFGSISSLTNCVLWGNTGGGTTIERRQVFGGGPSLSVNYSCVEGLTGLLGGVGNTGGDPLFVNALGADMLPGTADDDVHLGAGSSCIDAGDNAVLPGGVLTDLDGHLRFFDDPATLDSGSGGAPVVDMGAYEFGASAPIIGDVNCDGILNMNDAPALVGVLLGTDAHPCHTAAADMNGDGTANGRDIQSLVSTLLGP